MRIGVFVIGKVRLEWEHRRAMARTVQSEDDLTARAVYDSLYTRSVSCGGVSVSMLDSTLEACSAARTIEWFLFPLMLCLSSPSEVDLSMRVSPQGDRSLDLKRMRAPDRKRN